MAAFATEAGLTLICPATGLAYTPFQAWVRQVDGRRYTFSKCRHCDAAGRTRQERDFDPSNPQVHTHLLDEQER